jgi:hypothetical protein
MTLEEDVAALRAENTQLQQTLQDLRAELAAALDQVTALQAQLNALPHRKPPPPVKPNTPPPAAAPGPPPQKARAGAQSWSPARHAHRDPHPCLRHLSGLWVSAARQQYCPPPGSARFAPAAPRHQH